jgi:hypothetical protein
MGTFNPNHVSSTVADPAISALLRTPRDNPIEIFLHEDGAFAFESSAQKMEPE